MKPLFPGLPVKMLAFFLLVLVIPLKAAISKEKSHIRTLVIVSHPYPERSVMIKGLQQAAESVSRNPPSQKAALILATGIVAVFDAMEQHSCWLTPKLPGHLQRFDREC